MEDTPTDPVWRYAKETHPLHWSQAGAALADVVVVLLGTRYGSRPYGGSSPMWRAFSIVELEVLEARTCGAVVLCYKVGPQLLEEDFKQLPGTGEQPHYDGISLDRLARDLKAKELNTYFDFKFLDADLRKARLGARLRKIRYFYRRRRKLQVQVRAMNDLFEIGNRFDESPPQK